MKVCWSVLTITVLVALAACNRAAETDSAGLSHQIVGRWESIISFDKKGRQLTNAVASVDFLEDGTWISKGIDFMRGWYSVSGNQLSMYSSPDRENGESYVYIYTNGLLESSAGAHVSTMKRIGSQNN